MTCTSVNDFFALKTSKNKVFSLSCTMLGQEAICQLVSKLYKHLAL